jgi:hypothetical protein
MVTKLVISGSAPILIGAMTVIDLQAGCSAGSDTDPRGGVALTQCKTLSQ